MKNLLLLLLTSLTLCANPDQFRELFADPETRDEALAMLTPGTEEHYFHTALHHQLSGRDKEYAATIKAWKVAAKDSKQSVGDSRLDILEDRRRLKRFDKDPKAARLELINEWSFSFDDTKPDSAAEEKLLPTKVHSGWIHAKAFRKKAAEFNNLPERHYSPQALHQRLDDLDLIANDELRWYVGKSHLCQHPKYVDLLARALKIKNPISVSTIKFDQLTLKQMDALRKKVPDMASSHHFNRAYLRKLTPHTPQQLEQDPEAHAAFLEQCWDYAKDLPNAQMDLKAYVLYHHLRLQQNLNQHPEKEFLQLLSLPRRHHACIRPLKKADQYMNYSRQLDDTTHCQRIDDDTELIESYLEHFLAKSGKIDSRYEKLIKKEQLAKLHARARILAGADADSHARTLGAEAYRELREAVRIEFAPHVRQKFSAKDEVSLPVLLKNTPSLLIRTYELQGVGTYQQSSAAVELDGLVPHKTRRLEFKQDSAVRHLENISLPELEGAGSWIVELVSGRISARALIHKGLITPYITRTAEGQEVRLFDEDSKAIQDFIIDLGSESHAAKAGVCFIPNASDAPRNRGTVTAGKLISPIQLGSRRDRIQLETRFLLEREQLLAGKQASVLLRNQLTNHGKALPFERIENTTLILKAKMLGGVTTERVISDSLTLAERNEVSFLVPDNLLALSLELTATTEAKGATKPISLKQTQQYRLNSHLQADRIGMALFSPTREGTVLELRGRNGEPMTGHGIILTFTHVDYTNPISLKMRSDDNGQVHLGDLSNIARVRASSSSIATTHHQPAPKLSDPATNYVITDEDELRIPLLRTGPSSIAVEPTLIRWVQAIRKGPVTTVESLSSRLNIKNGFIQLPKLKAGHYRLDQRSQTVEIEVLPANQLQGELLVNAEQILPYTRPASPAIASTKIDKKSVIIEIAGASEHTRLTVAGKRYSLQSWLDGSAAYPFEPAPRNRVRRGSRPSAFLTSREISDEMRYIIDRRAAKKFPGVMLPRPGELLHRWTPEDLSQGDQDGEDESEGHGYGFGGKGASAIPSAIKKRGTANHGGEPHAVDFLDQSAVVRFDLKPDKEGRVEIPAETFKGLQFLHLIAADLQASDERIVPLQAVDVSLRDRRLARPLPPKSHHIATRTVASLAPGAEAEIRNLLDADWRAFTTLEQAHHFLLGSTNSSALRKFAFLPKWPELEEKEQLAYLAKHRCHELHLFLYRRDRAFFDQHIKPLLKAKPQPQFMDDYLLERDLAKYLQIHTFANLNAAEKALLAQSLPKSRTAIANELEQRWETEAPGPDAQTLLFTQTLKGADLNIEDSLGLAVASKTNELLVMAEGHYMLGKYDEAKRSYESILRIDPYNITARRGLERVAAIKSDYLRAAYDHTRTELLSQVDAAWEIPVPSDQGLGGVVTAGNRSGDFAIVGNSIDAILNNPNRGSRSGYDVAPGVQSLTGVFSSAPGSEEQFGVAYLSEKMRRIVIPSINFQDTTLTDAIEFLRMRAAELDSMELDPSKKGVNFVVRSGIGRGDVGLEEALGGAGGEPRIEELRVRNVPLEVALKYICDAAKVRYKVDNYAVTIVPQTETGEDIFTRTFTVPPDFRNALADADGGDGEVNPFDPVPAGGGSALEALPPVLELLKKSGIAFPEGASATLVGNKLLVSSTPTELDKVASLTAAVGSASPPALGGGDIQAFPVVPANPTGGGGGVGFGSMPGMPRFADHTRMWLESNYYQHRGENDESLIPLNRFWLDLAKWNGKGPFTSPHFNSCTTSDSDALMCLALLDLPFTADQPEVSVEDESLKVKARAPMLLFYKDTRETDQMAEESPLLVRQSYHPLAEPFRTVKGKQVENTHVGDFRVGTAYGVSLVITNPTGIERRIETLAQIPAGAIPLPPSRHHANTAIDAPATLSTSHDLKPYGVIRLRLAFYFPKKGDFSVYPLHVAEDGIILAHADDRTLRVVEEPAPEDSASWSVLARDGSSEAVLSRLASGNPAEINLEAILWRLKDRKFFDKTIAILRKRMWNGEDVEDVFAYGLHHGDLEALSDLLEMSGYGENLGSWFDSKLITVTPGSHHGWELMEFDPLVNPRAHAFGNHAYFTHEDAHDHYRRFLDDLAWKAELTSADQLTYTCFLLLQDRIEEALQRFPRIDPKQLPDTLQYDYLKSVILFIQEKPEEAKAIAEGYRGKLPPGVWKNRFETVIHQSGEISKPIETPSAAKEQSLASLKILQDTEVSHKLVLKHRNLGEAEIRLYHIDLEVLFSKDPFLSGGAETSLPSIAPNMSIDVPLNEKEDSTPYELPEEFRKGNILVAAQSGSYTHLKIMDSQALDLRIDPSKRILQVFDTATNKVLPKTYIKVYREMDNGSIDFHKDGYTDLRGTFDYLSHTGENPSKVKRLAILVSHPEKGARTTVIKR